MADDHNSPSKTYHRHSLGRQLTDAKAEIERLRKENETLKASVVLTQDVLSSVRETVDRMRARLEDSIKA